MTIKNWKTKFKKHFGENYSCEVMLLNANPTRGLQFVMYDDKEIFLCNEDKEILWKREIPEIVEITVDVVNNSSHENIMYVKLRNQRILALSHTGRILEEKKYQVLDERYEQYIKEGIRGASHFDYEPNIPVVFSKELSTGYYHVQAQVSVEGIYKLFDKDGMCVYEGGDSFIDLKVCMYERELFELRTRDQIKVNNVKISAIEDQQVIHFIGDSTMANQQRLPLYGWAQLHPLYTSKIVNNLAYSARSLKSFCFEGRFNELLNKLKKDDVVVIGFGHNDVRETYFGSNQEEYIDYLQYYIKMIKNYGAEVIITIPIAQRHYDGNEKLLNTHKIYEDAILEQIVDTKIVNLNRLLMKEIEKLGMEKSLELFNTHQSLEMIDNTHLSFRGALLVNELFIKECKYDL